MLSSKLEDKVKELWEALFQQPDGKQPMVYMPAWQIGLDAPDEDFHKPIYGLDASHPKTLEFVQEIFKTYRQLGRRVLHDRFSRGRGGYPEWYSPRQALR